MLAKQAIQQARESTNYLWEQYLVEKAAGGSISCLNPEVLYKEYIQTDTEILEKYEALGFIITDKEEYLDGNK